LPVANFVAYARYKKESWLFSAVSFTGEADLKAELRKQSISDSVVMTQVVPALNSSLPVVEDARRALGTKLTYVSLEGYIVGRLFLAILNKIEGPLTRENFLKAAYGRTFDLSGLKIDFTKTNQGSDLVQLTYLNKNGFEAVVAQDLVGMVRQ